MTEIVKVFERRPSLGGQQWSMKGRHPKTLTKADDSHLSSASSAVPRVADIGALWRVSRIMLKTHAVEK
jgi:hypothetical protein